MITGLSLSTIAHSTEDQSKVRAALLNLVPAELRVLHVSSAEAEGHHGNPIVLLSLEIRDRDAAKDAVDYLLRLLPVSDRLRIRDNIDRLYDGRSAVFLRIDKQTAFLNEPRLSDSDDVVKVKVSLSIKKEDIAAVLCDLGLGLCL